MELSSTWHADLQHGSPVWPRKPPPRWRGGALAQSARNESPATHQRSYLLILCSLRRVVSCTNSSGWNRFSPATRQRNGQMHTVRLCHNGLAGKTCIRLSCSSERTFATGSAVVLQRLTCTHKLACHNQPPTIVTWHLLAAELPQRGTEPAKLKNPLYDWASGPSVASLRQTRRRGVRIGSEQGSRRSTVDLSRQWLQHSRPITEEWPEALLSTPADPQEVVDVGLETLS